MFRWLHVSDFHFDGSADADPYDIEKVVKPLVETVRSRANGGDGPDYIFLTGDVARTGSSADYAAARPFLDELLDAASLTGSELVIVPGNHDVDRKPGRLLLRTLPDPDSADRVFFRDPSARDAHKRKFDAYAAFVRSLTPGRPFAEGDVVHEPFVVERNGTRIGVLSLNSAWFSQDDNDRGQLWVGTRLVRQRAEDLREAGAEIIITLLHHPYSYFADLEDAKVWIRAASDVVLCGHLHQPEVEEVTAADRTTLDVVAGGAYIGSRSPCRIYFGALDPIARTVELTPFHFVDKPGARTWVLDTAVFPGEGAGHRKTFRLPPKRPDAAPTTGAPNEFPFSSWEAVNRWNWLNAIVDWFGPAYAADPELAMEAVVSHSFAIIRNAGGQENLRAYVSGLATALRTKLDGNSNAALHGHHEEILRLLEFGIEYNLSHLYMVPAVDPVDLLDVPAHSSVMLATRELAAGDFQQADLLARQVGEGCCIALYVMGQSARKLGFLYEARNLMNRAQRLVATIESGSSPYQCNVSRTLSCICNRDLLQAEIERAQGVIARRVGDEEEAERRYEAATAAALDAAGETRPSAKPALLSGAIEAKYAVDPRRVIADVNFSHGYYWFERSEWERSSELFERAISSLEQSNEEWDSPYTRLAIVRLRQGAFHEARDLFLSAREICRRTGPRRNREAPLSGALCTLGLKVLEARTGVTFIDGDPLNEARDALTLSPPLAIAALECHAADAEKLVDAESDSATKEIVAAFIALLERERQAALSGRAL